MLSLDMMFMVIMMIDIHMLNKMSPSIAVTGEISMGINIMNNNNMMGMIFYRDVPGGFGADMQPNRQTCNMAPFHCYVHQTQNPIKIETDEKNCPKPKLKPQKSITTHTYYTY